jgi:transposase-like protein
VLVELRVMEQRYQAVLAVVQDGWKVVEVADRLGVSRQSVHNWIARYEHGGLMASPIVHNDRTDVRTKRAVRSRLSSARSGASIPAGDPGASSTSCRATASIRSRDARESIVPCCPICWDHIGKLFFWTPSCGKPRVVPHNRRPKPEPTEVEVTKCASC